MIIVKTNIKPYFNISLESKKSADTIGEIYIG